MKSFRNYIAVTLAVLALSFVTVNAQSFSANTSSLERQIFKRINSLPYYGVFDFIQYEVDNGGRVTLYGKTNSLGTRKSAERVVRRIPGVTSVVNNIDELPPSSFDNNIRRGIVREFVNSGGVYPYIREPNPSVRIIVENGRVTLEGYVPNRGTSNLMYLLANRVPGTFGVRNNLIVGRDRSR